jgi:hypothetical protein
MKILVAPQSANRFHTPYIPQIQRDLVMQGPQITYTSLCFDRNSNLDD